MISFLVLLPVAAGLAALAAGSRLRRDALSLVAAALHLLGVVRCWVHPPSGELGGMLGLDAPGLLFLTIASVLFLLTAVYGGGYFARADPRALRIYAACSLFFLASMTLVCSSRHLGLLWVGIEATTLATAPLVYFHRSDPRVLEATWKYLVLCSVGIAVALLGTFFVAIAAAYGPPEPTPLLLESLLARGPTLSAPWIKGGFLLLLVGYGTKMGLAPLHTWLPDAHSEAPAPVSALLSGALLNCAFLGVLRGAQVCAAAGAGGFARELLVLLGLVSVGIGAACIVGQNDLKRMLAYSSVEHMGILALGVGLGGGAAYGAMLHGLNHSLAKGLLFFAAGNVVLSYRTRSIDAVRGVLRRLPASGVLLLAGFLAITGLPPFGVFLSELTILNAAFAQGRGVVALLLLAFLSIVFIGMAKGILGLVQGAPPEGTPRERESPVAVGPPALLATAALALGVFVPGFLDRLLEQAARIAGG
ncbi:MAG TPA: proton-conducting transporter membrane subunit [Planctomycetota bacterium]|nr:proton-conducting transporter membrane subunit [Planctomycetota bacterium]